MATEISPAVLGLVLERTLEDAAFVFAEPAADFVPIEEQLVEARLRYSSDSGEGELRLVVPEALASALAANMLGEEEGGATVTGDDDDAAGELLNMVAGALTLELFGRYTHCMLGVPQVRRITAEEHERALAGVGACATLVDEDGRRVDLSITPADGARR